MQISMTKQQFVARVLHDRAAQKDFDRDLKAENRCGEMERLARIAQEREIKEYVRYARSRRRRH